MSNLTDTLKLALDALEDVEAGQKKVIDAITALREVLDHIEERLEMVEPAQERRVQQQFMDEEVLYLYTPRREALDEPVQPTETQLAYRRGYEQGKFDAAMEVAVQEPVAWLSRDDARLALWDAINKREFGNPTDDKLILDHLRKNGLWIGKYTSPPASKPWVGLTDVEWMNIVNKDHAWFGQRPEDVAHEVAKLVEAKLKEKNT